MKRLIDYVFKGGKGRATQTVEDNENDLRLLPSVESCKGDEGDKLFQNYFDLMERVEKEKDFFNRIRNLFYSRDSRALIVPYEAEKSFSYTMAIDNKADKDDFYISSNSYTNDGSELDNEMQMITAQRSL